MLRLGAVALVVGWSAVAHAQLVTPVLYLNRCSGNCTVYGSNINDARAMKSTVPCAGGANCGGGSCSCSGGSTGTFTIEEFQDSNGNTGGLADAEWEAILHCVREVYSPYDIEVRDTLPPGGQSHNLGIVAGRSQNIGYTGVGGISPGTPCAPRDNAISFTFANQYGGTGMERVWAICGTVAQETAHAYGLDHSFQFSDGRSACSDPMTYQPDCGQKFFRFDDATCGEYAARPCQCGPTQNAHRRLLGIFGAGTPITRPPVVTVMSPSAGQEIPNGSTVTARASAQRGIARVDLFLNGYKWATAKGVEFGPSGQPEAVYALTLPPTVPNGVIDIEVKAYDDIEVETTAPLFTVTKGEPCTSAQACALGQVCEDGRCFWDEPVGEVGDACEFPQYCKAGLECIDTSDGSFCSHECVVGVGDSCERGTYCEGPAGQKGYCLAKEDGGCCSAGGDRRGPIVLALLVFAVIVRPRRSRRT